MTIRIAHISPAFFSDDSIMGGGERYVYNLAQSLRNVGDVEQYILSHSQKARRFDHDGLAVKLLPNESPFQGPMDAFSSQLWEELAGIDLAHIHQPLTISGAYATSVAASLNIPMVGTDLGGGQNPLMLKGRGIELMDGLLSISKYAQETISGYYKGPHEVMIGPVDTNFFSADPRVERDRSMVLVVSRILPHKGIDRVIKALPPDLHLVIVGRVYDEKYHRLLQTMAQGKRVQFIHDASDTDLVNYYRQTGLFIQASTTKDIYGNIIAKPELMGLTTLEAMACGAPAVVSDAGSLHELVPDRRFGRVFSDHAELEAIFADFAAGRWPAEPVAEMARAHVVKNHSAPVIGARLAEFYRATIASARGRG